MPNVRTTPATVAAHSGVYFAVLITDEGTVQAGDDTYQPLAIAAARLADHDETPRVELDRVVVRVRKRPDVGIAVMVVDKGHPVGKSVDRFGKRMLKTAAFGRDLRPAPSQPEPASAP